MRTILLLTCAGLVGCANENELQYRSTLQTQTDGVALSEDGLLAYAAMSGTTCTIDTRWGCPVADEDLPTEEEQVLDHYEGTTLARSARTLHLLRGGAWQADADVEIEGLRTARLTQRGLLALSSTADGCILRGEDAQVPVPAALCSSQAQVDVDRTGALVVAVDGVYRVDLDGAVRIAERGDLVAVEPLQGRIVTATRGEHALAAYDAAGNALWSMSLEGEVTDLAARGDTGDVLVVSHTDGDMGEIDRVEVETGVSFTAGQIPQFGVDIVVSWNGRMVAVITESEVHHYEIVVAGEPTPIAEDVGECISLPVRESQGFSTD